MQGNLKKLLKKIKKNDIVLDVGGCSKPLTRANYVIDLLGYEKRGKYGFTGKEPERFNFNTWIKHDICGHRPFPFKDKKFDFVFCSHVLEDVKDPIWVCSEIMRIGKRGYIETPSRWIESKIGVAGKYKFPKKLAGFFNHQWFVETENNKLIFTQKNPFIYIIKEFQIKDIPTSIVEFYWESSFDLEERLILTFDDAIYNLLNFKLKEVKTKKKKEKLRKRAKKILSLTFWQKVKRKLKTYY